MARKQRIAVCALNVVIHDENKRDYSKLLKNCSDKHDVVQFNKTHAACLIGVKESFTPYGNYLFGTVFKFVNIRPPYFDINKLSLILDEDGNPKNIIDPQIRSNTLDVNFCLFEDSHRIFVDVRNITPKMAKDFFERIFKREEIVAEFGEVDVSLHSTKEYIEEILRIPSLRSLEIFVHRPNPTNMNRFDFDVEESLREQNAESLQHRLATRSDNITPNELTKNFMNAARNNGRVIGRGRDEDGKTVEFDTDNSPLVDSIFTEKNEPYLFALARAAQKVWEKITTQDG
ncbi:DUF4747 family protein [Desulfovibrio sp. UIB00]|uniref:DUF4747 family protein n=1 Tax=Desulfovibrio sp. UIB00 TaxID=2804314 RepID=UPI001F110A77|nr:DUF4747 family protein [Desulfovibrio sp. UIB00]MCH5143671.1 DUF4747 family protein [Desulfovibrio sp. UIB00]